MQKRGFIYISGSMDEAQPWYVNALKQYKNGDGHGGWRSFSIPSYDNLAVYPLGEKDEEIETLRRELPEDEFARKILALPAPPTGLVFKEFDPDIHVVPIDVVESTTLLAVSQGGSFQPLTESNVRSISVTPDMHRDEIDAALRAAYSPFGNSTPLAVPVVSDNGFTIKGWKVSEDAEVEIAVDPGWEHGYAVLAIVKHKDAILVIDEVYEQMKTGEEVINECRARPWWPRVKRGVIDRAGTQHQMNMSEHEKWRKLAGLTLRYVFVPIPDGISRYRTFLFDPSNGRPRLYVSPQCDNFIWEHSNYRYPQYREGRAMRELPIDAANHAIKALTYYIVVNYGFTERTGGTTSRKYIEKKTKSLVESRSDWMYQDSFK